MKKTVLISILLLLVLFGTKAKASPDLDLMKTSIPKELSTINHFGTEFLLSIPPCIDDDIGSGENKIKIYISSFTNTYVTVSGRYNYYQIREIRPYQTVELDVPVHAALPFLKSTYEPAKPEILFTNSALRIVSDEPVAVYVVVRFTKASDAFLAYPVSSLGKRYVVSSYNDASAEYPGFYSLPSMSAVIAAYDNTVVHFFPGGNDLTNLSGTDSLTKVMKKGDVWLLSSVQANADLSGSVVVSTLPVAVVSGNQCANIPIGNKYCDYIVEMETPVPSWGYTFHIPIIKGRKKSPVLRIYAAMPNTEVYLDGEKLTTIETAGGKIDKGYFEYRINIGGSAKIGVISSNKPIAVSLYNPGVQEDSNPEPLGDPFQMSLVPLEQYHNEILYTTRGINNTEQYYESYISLNYKKDVNNQIPDDLEIGVFDGKKFIWSPVKNITPIIHKDFVANSKGEQWANFTFNFMSEGVFKVRSTTPICAYYYGLTFNEGIGFPLAMGLMQLSSPDREKPRVTATQDCLGEVKGKTKDFPDDQSLRSNLAYPIFFSDSSYNYDKVFGAMIYGETREIDWKLTVRDKDKPARAVVLFRDMAGNDTLIVVQYSPIKVKIEPDIADFGSIKTGTFLIKEFKLTNESDDSIDIKELRLALSKKGFEIVPPLPIRIIDPRETVYFYIKFAATEFGEFTDSLGVGDGCRFHYKVLLKAKVGNPEIFAGDVSFYDVTITKPITKQFAVQNKGKSELTIHGYSGPFSGEYLFLPIIEISNENPLIIKPGEYKVFDLTFNPTKEGAAPDSIIFHNDAFHSDSITMISGRGIQPKLSVESYNWGRKRVFSAKNPIQPYPIENANGMITFENIGSAELTVKNIELVASEKDKNAFILNIEHLKGKTISPGQKIYLEVTFLPKEARDYYLQISISDENDYNVVSVLSGTGISPKYSVDTIDFGTTLVGDFKNFKQRTIVIANASENDYPYHDTLRINSLQFSPDNAVSINTGYGTEGFRVNFKDLAFPIVLAPGEKVMIFTYFAAAKPGQNKAFLKPISNMPIDDSFTLIGNGEDSELSISTETVSACLNETVVINVEFKNNASESMQIGQLFLENSLSGFSFVNPTDALGFDLKPSESKIIKIKYYSTFEGMASNKLLLTSQATNQVIDSVLLIVSTNLTNRFTLINPVQQTASIGQTANLRLILSPGENIEHLSIKEVDVLIFYDSDFLVTNLNTVTISPQLSGLFRIIDLKTDIKGTISFKLKSIANATLNSHTELAKLSFDILLPNENSNSALITANYNISSSTCVRFLQAQSRINLKPECAIDIRKVKGSGYIYSLGQVQSPIHSSEEINISFSIGLSAHTTLSVYSSSGELIYSPISEHIEAGEYSIALPINKINSGVYFYKISSGPFEETKKFIVAK